MKILIVDDYPANLRLLRAALEAEGHCVLQAANGREALECLQQESVDGIISDVLMPTMDGFRLCNEVRKTPALAQLPLVLYTATYNSASDRALAQSVGADAYVLKPAPTSELIAAIHDAQARPETHTVTGTNLQEKEVLERYNGVLIRKLEARNQELEQTLSKLGAAHDQILELNRSLETRVAQRTAALDAANRELEAFSFTISHDLRSPLRQVIGFADLLRAHINEAPPCDSAELAERIMSSATHMAHLIDALLEFARTARTPLTLAEVDLEPLLDEALAAVAAEAAGRNIEWRRTQLPKVKADATLLRQVLINLLSNAIKYTRGRDPAIIEIGHRAGRAEEVVVFVRDNGAGFDVRRAGELFGVFRRLHDSSLFEGTGVGLATAHRIVQRHGGHIWADAQVDKGATFSFSLGTA